jgi:regulator of replication initiation timing
MSSHPVNGWFVSARDLISALALLVTIIAGVSVFFLSRESSTAKIATQVGELVENNRSLVLEIKDLNKEGTRGSQTHIATVEEVTKANTDRIKSLESSIYGPNGLNEKFTDVQSKLTLIANLLEGKKQAAR